MSLLPRRVVVTGLGVVSPLGTGLRPFWDRLVAGASGVVSLKALAEGAAPPAGFTKETLQRWDKGDAAQFSQLNSTVAALVQFGPKQEGCFDPRDWLSPQVWT